MSDPPLQPQSSLPVELFKSLNQSPPPSREEEPLCIQGLHNPLSLSWLISQCAKFLQKINVVCLPSSISFKEFEEQLLLFNPNLCTHHLPSFDVSPYSNLPPNKAVAHQRLNWLFEAQNSHHNHVFLASLKGLLQTTLPYENLSRETYQLQIGNQIPDHFHRHLSQIGYTQTPLVEDLGTFSQRGFIFDIFSPAHGQPIRIELLGNEIENIRFFNPETQRSTNATPHLTILPAKEAFFNDENRQLVAKKYRNSFPQDSIPSEDKSRVLRAIASGQLFPEIDFLLPYFYERPALPLSHFNKPVQLWLYEDSELRQDYTEFLSSLNSEREGEKDNCIQIDYKCLYSDPSELLPPPDSQVIYTEKISLTSTPENTTENTKKNKKHFLYQSSSVEEFQKNCQSLLQNHQQLLQYIELKLKGWKEEGYSIFIATRSQRQQSRLQILFEEININLEVLDETACWDQWIEQQNEQLHLIHLLPHLSYFSARLHSERLIFLRDSDLFGSEAHSPKYGSSGSLKKRTASTVDFSDLEKGNIVVHKVHGIGVYEGLIEMSITGIPAEFILLRYKNNDKLYLPIYGINQLHKYSAPHSHKALDKLGNTVWKQTKKRVKKRLQDIAAQLLKLYSEREQIRRPAFTVPNNDFRTFESSFPFQETRDQATAIQEVLTDMTSDKPMDRLICGDVGFGKTEVAMRASFKAIQDHTQVAIVVPTTVLCLQHLESFKKRFKSWPINICALNRLTPKKEIKKNLENIKNHKVDIVVGTHRLLSHDVQFLKLGLLIVDEEQKFGVKHKERIRQLQKSVDTLTLSATPIPRTLNMSLVGLRDLSIINTPPKDRLPTRTFVCKHNIETIRKAIESELSRGGQVFFLHNRVNSIDAMASELRSALPKARIAVGHGQMDETLLEKNMLSFYNQEIDILLCTTIIESGVDVGSANTMIINDAHRFGLSQLYQLRGRVGRSKDRAYCYLIIPKTGKLDKIAQERLKVIQENTALGSGIRVAQHDLELRGAGDLLGAEQSGHVNSVGYEMYMELLEEAIHEQKGEKISTDDIDPEINLRIPAFIPEKYVPHIKMRLNYYKALSRIENESELDQFEDDFRDQFGKVPEEVQNLMGIMLIRKCCKQLGVKNITETKIGVKLIFSDHTKFPPQKAIELSQKENKKYSLSPGNKFTVRIKNPTWPRVHEEVKSLTQFLPRTQSP